MGCGAIGGQHGGVSEIREAEEAQWPPHAAQGHGPWRQGGAQEDSPPHSEGEEDQLGTTEAHLSSPFSFPPSS